MSGRPRKWKRCPDCRKRKRLDEDYYHWVDRGTPRQSTCCKTCTCRRDRARRADRMADPYLLERYRARQREYKRRPEVMARNTERCRRYRAKLKRERPEVYQQQLEDARIRNRRQHEGRALHVKTGSLPPDPKRWLPAEPLLRYLAGVEYQPRHETAQRALLRVVNENRRSRLLYQTADLLITDAGGALALVYPEVYA